MCGSATLTTVASSIAIPLAATVATRATRPFAECRTKPSAIAPVVALVTAARLLLSPAASVHHGAGEGDGRSTNRANAFTISFGMMSKFTRGFTGRRRAADPRLPPGQYDT